METYVEIRNATSGQYEKFEIWSGTGTSRQETYMTKIASGYDLDAIKRKALKIATRKVTYGQKDFYK